MIEDAFIVPRAHDQHFSGYESSLSSFPPMIFMAPCISGIKLHLSKPSRPKIPTTNNSSAGLKKAIKSIPPKDLQQEKLKVGYLKYVSHSQVKIGELFVFSRIPPHNRESSFIII